MSANVVGYQTLDTQGSDMTLLGVNFQAVGGGSLSVQNAFSGDFVGGMSPSQADQLMVWSVQSGYTSYFFGDWDDGLDYNQKWYLNGDDETPTADLIPAGAGVWLVRRGSSSPVTCAGEVNPDPSAAFTIKANDVTLWASAYPAAVPLNGNTLTVENPVGGMSPSQADQLMVWSAQSGYTSYFFGDWDDGLDYNQKWYLNGDDETPTADLVPAGAAVWYVNRGPQKTLTITSPL